jgi:hypothetical protein
MNLFYVLGVVAFASLAIGAFAASAELRAFAAATISSADIVDESLLSVDVKNGEIKGPDLAGNSVTSGKIKDGEVKVNDIGADSIGASELIGVTRLLFAECQFEDNVSRAPGEWYDASCAVPGTTAGDRVVVSRSTDFNCYDINGAYTTDGFVHVKGRNDCDHSAALGKTWFSIIVFAK